MLPHSFRGFQNHLALLLWTCGDSVRNGRSHLTMEACSPHDGPEAMKNRKGQGLNSPFKNMPLITKFLTKS